MRKEFILAIAQKNGYEVWAKWADNSAFEENPREMAELLERLANYYRDCQILPDTARDSNGNTVCHITQE